MRDSMLMVGSTIDRSPMRARATLIAPLIRVAGKVWPLFPEGARSLLPDTVCHLGPWNYLAARRSRLSGPAPFATSNSNPPAIDTFLRNMTIATWSLKLLWKRIAVSNE